MNGSSCVLVVLVLVILLVIGPSTSREAEIRKGTNQESRKAGGDEFGSQETRRGDGELGSRIAPLLFVLVIGNPARNLARKGKPGRREVMQPPLCSLRSLWLNTDHEAGKGMSWPQGCAHLSFLRSYLPDSSPSSSWFPGFQIHSFGRIRKAGKGIDAAPLRPPRLCGEKKARSPLVGLAAGDLGVVLEPVAVGVVAEGSAVAVDL